MNTDIGSEKEWCRHCGLTRAESGMADLADYPVYYAVEHCGKCPPWTCEDCGEPTSATGTEPGLCSCWTAVEGMPLADIKAVFAAVGLSVDTATEEA